MTTGNLTFGTFGYTAGASSKVWNGGNGRLEIFQNRSRTKWNNYSCVVRHQYGCKQSTKGYYINVNGIPGDFLTSNDRIAVLGKLSEKIKGSTFNLAVNAAQSKQTIDMVCAGLRDVALAIRDLKRGNFQNAARRLGVKAKPSKLKSHDISGRWLELQYGWLPMLGDIYEAAKAFEEYSNPPRTMRFQVKSGKRIPYNGSQSPSNFDGFGSAYMGTQIIAEIYESLSTERKLGLTDPASVLWEITPYSFVIDWFLPIGDYLEVLNSIPNLDGRYCTTSVKRCFASGVGKPTSFYYAGGTSNYMYNSTTRTISTSLTVPLPSIEGLADAMSPKRIFNAIALAHQAIK